jgi:hypothetical protein
MSNKKLKSFLIVLFAFLIFFVFWGYFLFNLSFSNSINYSFAEEATSTSEIATSTNTSTTDVAVSTTTISERTISMAMDIITSTTTSTIPIENENIENATNTATSSLGKTISTVVSLDSQSDSQISSEDEGVEESASEEITQPQEEQPQPPQPITKERKLNKEIKIKKDAQYFCKTKSFYIDISNINNERIFEIEFEGKKPKNGVLEIGSLPLGIDITFLNKADYEWNVSQNENIAVLQIIKQVFSQKGNFNIPIIYTDKDSRESVICQINIINF